MDILFINALPFLVAALLAIPPIRQSIPKTVQTIITSGSMALLFVALLGYFSYVEDNHAIKRTIEWMPDLGIDLAYHLDGLALLFALVVSGIGTVIFFYSGYYFDDKEEQGRFNTILMVFYRRNAWPCA